MDGELWLVGFRTRLAVFQATNKGTNYLTFGFLTLETVIFEGEVFALG